MGLIWTYPLVTICPTVCELEHGHWKFVRVVPFNMVIYTDLNHSFCMFLHVYQRVGHIIERLEILWSSSLKLGGDFAEVMGCHGATRLHTIWWNLQGGVPGCPNRNSMCIKLDTFNVNPGFINPGWLIVVVPPNSDEWLLNVYLPN